MTLSDYTDQQSRIDRAFSDGGSCCGAHCEACGRTYFVTSSGHGDYEEGELERLYELSRADPDKYIEVPDYSSVATMTHPLTNQQVVIGCVCDPTLTLADFIERNARQLTKYLREFWKAKRVAAAARLEEAQQALAALGWSSMDVAPKDGSWIEVELADGTICHAHWCSDLSGEEQPPFEGWFAAYGTSAKGKWFVQVFPLHWRAIDKEDVSE